MPPLNETLSKGKPGFEDVVRPQVPPPMSLPGQGTFRNNPFIRTVLPPFSANIDTLRQFNEGGTDVPRRRVIPLPITTGVGGSTTINNSTTVVSSSGGGGSTGVTLTAKTVVVTTPSLPDGGISTQTIVMAKSFQLIAAVSDSPCCLRIYGSPGAQSTDSSRAVDAPVPAELVNGIITDLVFDSPPFTWNFQNIVGVNADNPQDTHAFITIINNSGNTETVQITLVFLPLES